MKWSPHATEAIRGFVERLAVVERASRGPTKFGKTASVVRPGSAAAIDSSPCTVQVFIGKFFSPARSGTVSQFSRGGNGHT